MAKSIELSRWLLIAASMIPQASHNGLLFLKDVASDEQQMPAIQSYPEIMEAVLTVDACTARNNLQDVLQARLIALCIPHSR